MPVRRVSPNPSLALRLRVALALLLLALVAIAGLGIQRLFAVRSDFEDGTATRYRVEVAAQQQQGAFLAERFAVLAARSNPADSRIAYERARTTAGPANVELQSLTRTLPASRAILADRNAAAARWRRQAADPVLRGEPISAQRERTLSGHVQELDRRLIARQETERMALRDRVDARSQWAIVVVLLAFAAAFVVAMVVFSGMVASHRRPLADLIDAARRLARGELGARAAGGGPSETNELSQAFNDMAEELGRAYSGVEEERGRLATMIASLGDGLLTIDRHGVVSLVNPAARQILPDATPGTTLRDALGVLAPSELELRRLSRGALPGELRLAGGGRTLALQASSLETAEGGAVITIRDVSERARVERMKDEFVATVSHELRSPLTSIKGFAELMLLDDQGLSSDQRENVQIIDESTARLVELVNDLLDLARSDAGRLTIDPRPSRPIDLVSGPARLLEPRIDGADQTLVVDVPEDLPTVDADPGRIRQVLTNLLTNAHLYAGRGATLRVEAASAVGGIRFAVADDGPGIPPDQRDRLFDRFWRGNARESQEVSGSGLGLSIARSLVELHRGEIDVDSTPGRGTRVGFLIPWADRDEPRGVRPPRALIAHTDSPTARLLERALREVGLDTGRAYSARDAAERLAERGADVVVVGLDDDEIEGLTLLSALHSAGNGDPTPTLAIAVHAGLDGQRGERLVQPVSAESDLRRACDDALSADRDVMVCCDSPRARAAVSAAFAAHGREPRVARTALEAAVRCRAEPFDLLIVHTELTGARALLTALESSHETTSAQVVLLDETSEGPPPAVNLEVFAERTFAVAQGHGNAPPAVPQRPAPADPSRGR